MHMDPVTRGLRPTYKQAWGPGFLFFHQANDGSFSWVVGERHPDGRAMALNHASTRMEAEEAARLGNKIRGRWDSKRPVEGRAPFEASSRAKNLDPYSEEGELGSVAPSDEGKVEISAIEEDEYISEILMRRSAAWGGARSIVLENEGATWRGEMCLPRLKRDNLEAEVERCERVMEEAEMRREILRYNRAIDELIPLSQQLVEAWIRVGEWRDLLQGVYKRISSEGMELEAVKP